MVLKESEAVLDLLCEFLEAAIHNILYVRKLYPDVIFEKRKKYGVGVYQSIHPQVNEYISESLKAVRHHAKANQLKRLLICTVLPGGVVYDRFVFDVVHLKNSFEKDPLYIKLEGHMREFYLKLHASTLYLQAVPDDASFRIMLHTTEYSSLSLNNDPTFDDFPWIHVSEKEFNISSPDIVPIHTVDADPIALQIYVEKCIE